MGRRLSIVEKAEIIKKLSEPRATQTSVAKMLGVSRRTVQNAMKKEGLINEQLNNGNSRKRCHLKVDQKYGEVNDAIFQWFTRMREKHGEIPISESIICHKAMHFAKIMGVGEFKASNGWFRSWKTRHGLSSYKVSKCCHVLHQ